MSPPSLRREHAGAASWSIAAPGTLACRPTRLCGARHHSVGRAGAAIARSPTPTCVGTPPQRRRARRERGGLRRERSGPRGLASHAPRLPLCSLAGDPATECRFDRRQTWRRSPDSPEQARPEGRAFVIAEASDRPVMSVDPLAEPPPLGLPANVSVRPRQREAELGDVEVVIALSCQRQLAADPSVEPVFACRSSLRSPRSHLMRMPGLAASGAARLAHPRC